MSKEELTKAIAQKLEEIRKLYFTEHPEGRVLILSAYNDYMFITNEHREGETDERFPIDECIKCERIEK